MHATTDTARADAPPGSAAPASAPAPPAAPATRAVLDETTLVVRAQEGDVHAFEELARRHQDALFRVAVRVLGNRADAEDALQEALLDAWKKIGAFRGEAAFSTWMYRIVTNRCTALLRRSRPTVPVSEIGDDALASPGSHSPERAAEMDAEMAALSRAVARLPEEQRTCWVLRELEGLGYAEIAEITGAGETAVRGRIHRARTALAEGMREWR
ncbi:sigma-70 family RNA polymerase sigma factor [Pseudonocardia sp. KRD291]|uniref:RNA polymerase sigma factor n=1 Tax=Pseudonocardia sp. KRD291 TaxID=2792007 RepID=UPI001C5C41AD|nr:sigma-70 family RNA polymerase sigma factor [Pseudonocardia sp. KRD291]MBW0104875.1 sigma-70 family RNA polymerase sigma factor [Pseudonocardia sp. KRD291]